MAATSKVRRAVPCMLDYPERFFAAVMFAADTSKHKVEVTDENRLLLYALFQQVTEGVNKTYRPWGPFVSSVDQAKWDAWTHCGDMEAMEACRLYVATVDGFCSNWWQLLTDGGDEDKLADVNKEVEEMSELLRTKLVHESQLAAKQKLNKQIADEKQKVVDSDRQRMLQRELHGLIEDAEQQVGSNGGIVDPQMQEGIEEALEVAERMLKAQRERPTPVGFRFTIDEEAHTELRTAQMERVSSLLMPLSSTYSVPPGETVEFDDEQLRPTQAEPRNREVWMNQLLSDANYAADVIKAAHTQASSAIKITERAAGFDWLAEATVLDSVVQTQLALVGEAMGKEPDFATVDAEGDSAEELMRQQQDSAEKSAAATLAALDKLQPNTVPLEELVEAFENEVEADALLATQNCHMLAPGYLDQVDLEITVQVEARAAHVNEERAAYDRAARKRRLEKAEVELQRESRKAELENQLLVQSAANVKKEEARVQAVLANPVTRERLHEQEEVTAMSAVAVSLPLPHEAGRSSTAAEPNTDVMDRDQMDALSAKVRMSEEDTWVTATVGGTPPPARHEHAACMVGSRMLVFGGRRSATLFSDVHALDLASLKWTEVEATAGQPPRAASGHVAVTLRSGQVALLGGLGKETTASDQIALHLFDPVTASWSAPAMHGQVPSARAGFSVCELGGALWIFGGEDANRDVVDDMLVLNMDDMTWSVPPLSTARVSMQRSAPALAYHTATSVDNRFIVVFGGMDADGDHSSMLYFLDTRTRQWVAPTVMGEPPAARAGHAAALLGARWLLAGGGGGDAPVITSLCLNLGTLEAGFVRWEAPVRLPTHAATPSLPRETPQRGPLTSEGLSLVAIPSAKGGSVLAFGGSDGACYHTVHVLSPMSTSTQNTLLGARAMRTGVSVAEYTDMINVF